MSSTHIHIRDFKTEIPGARDADGLTWRFPVVTGMNTHGRATTWAIYTRILIADTFVHIQDEYYNNSHIAGAIGWINVDAGIEGGKTRTSSPTLVRVGKNIGKASATNVWTQALRDALGLYNKQLKKVAGVMAARSTSSVARDEVHLYPPMLAQTLSAQKKPLDMPVSVQRKYNGVRTVATRINGEVLLYSRRRNIYPAFSYIKLELQRLFAAAPGAADIYFDGEIYKHDVPLQEISGIARRADTPDDIRFDYMIYDCFVPADAAIWSTRAGLLKDIFERVRDMTYCKYVETFTADSIERVHALYEQFISEGYEGAMVRIDAPYEYSYNDHHSKSLLKMKRTLDAEFTLVGWETGTKGKAAAALMVICAIDSGARFPVTPALELAERIVLAAKMAEVEPNGRTHFENHWQNARLIVYYDEVSRDGIPQRARTKMETRVWD